MATSFHNMATIFAAILDFSKILFLQTVANFTEICRKHVFVVASRNIIKN